MTEIYEAIFTLCDEHGYNPVRTSRGCIQLQQVKETITLIAGGTLDVTAAGGIIETGDITLIRTVGFGWTEDYIDWSCPLADPSCIERLLDKLGEFRL